MGDSLWRGGASSQSLVTQGPAGRLNKNTAFAPRLFVSDPRHMLISRSSPKIRSKARSARSQDYRIPRLEGVADLASRPRTLIS